MPYSLPVHSQGRAGHRRSYSHIAPDAGAFTSLGALPRRRSTSAVPLHYPVPTPKKPPTFHFRQDHDDDDDDDSSDEIIHNDDDDDDADGRLRGLPPLRLKHNFNAVPFPRSSPIHSPPLHTSPPPSRTSSVLLSNGKPLKSSLKSSSSSPNIPFPSQSLVPSIMFPDLHHQRASSAPCTPLLDTKSPFVRHHLPSPLSSSPSTSRSPSPSSPLQHHAPKNVHFPSQEEGGLATIRLFNRSARPASLSRLGEETETETEGEGSSAANNGLYPAGGWAAGWSGKYVGGSTYPFPRVPTDPASDKDKKSPLNPSTQRQKQMPHDIDWSQSSTIPRKNLDLANENLFFESLKVVEPETQLYSLQGTLLVRNITYQKSVIVRYTLDNWETVNDVSASYDDDGAHKQSGWDRFKFSISLGDVNVLQDRFVSFVGRYVAGGGVLLTPEIEGVNAGGEWWDNNGGNNYKVGFRKLEVEKEAVEKPYKRGVVVSAPSTYVSPTPPPPPTTTPTPTSILTRPKLSSPQLSSNSLSFPSPRQYQYQPEEEREKQQEQQEQHQAALTQSTFARLKKLNLKNYAAPRGYALPSKGPSLETPELKFTSASPTTRSFGESPTFAAATPVLEMSSSPTLSMDSTDTASTDSTPLQTPTHEDSDEDSEVLRKPGVGEERRWSLGMENGHFTSVMMISSSPRSGSVTPTASAIIPTQARTYPTTTGVEMGTSPPFSDLEESVIGGGGRKGGSVYWDWGSAGAAVLGEEVRKEMPSTSSPSVATGGLMPPQRRRPQRASGLSTAGNGNGSSDSAAAGSKAPSTLAFPTFPTSVPTTTTTTIPPKQKPTPPKINLPVRQPMGVVQSPPYPGSPRRYLPQPQQAQQAQRNGHHRHYQPTSPTTTNGGGGGVTPVSSPSDAIYQALVREWCFAQGPGPVTTTATTTTGETTVVRSMVPLSEGE